MSAASGGRDLEAVRPGPAPGDAGVLEGRRDEAGVGRRRGVEHGDALGPRPGGEALHDEAGRLTHLGVGILSFDELVDPDGAARIRGGTGRPGARIGEAGVDECADDPPRRRVRRLVAHRADVDGDGPSGREGAEEAGLRRAHPLGEVHHDLAEVDISRPGDGVGGERRQVDVVVPAAGEPGARQAAEARDVRAAGAARLQAFQRLVPGLAQLQIAVDELRLR